MHLDTLKKANEISKARSAIKEKLSHIKSKKKPITIGIEIKIEYMDDRPNPLKQSSNVYFLASSDLEFISKTHQKQIDDAKRIVRETIIGILQEDLADKTREFESL